MRQGFIRWYNHNKGYGFIQYKDSTDKVQECFMHYTAIENDVDLKEGDLVTFDLYVGVKGDQALNVIKD